MAQEEDRGQDGGNPPNDGQDESLEAAAVSPRVKISLGKLIWICVLLCLCVFLQCMVWTLEVLLEEQKTLVKLSEEKRLNGRKAKRKSVRPQQGVKTTTTTTTAKKTIRTLQLTTDERELHLNRLFQSFAESGFSNIGSAYWREAVELWLSSWDPNVGSLDTTTTATTGSSTTESMEWATTTTSNTTALVAWTALEKAAEQGHAYAQFHLANALASGILPGSQVQDAWTIPDSPQQQRAWLLWQMAAIAGNVEASLALAHRLDQSPLQTTTTTTSTTTSTTTTSSTSSFLNQCQMQLPYYQQAALGIVDALQVDLHSRAKVLPASDKHVLYQIHLHGGAPSRLEYHNKADESPDALQFYHLKAFSSRKSEAASAANAAYTLANYYHYGVRGVAQNLTLAAHYYERAANLNHWEAAGQVGMFYLWGMGVAQDAYQAHKYFRIGMPLGITGCQRRLQLKLKKTGNIAIHNSKNPPTDNSEETDDNNPEHGEIGQSSADAGNEEELSLCDTESMNGMGVLKLVGLPHIMKVDVLQAEELFIMARDQGNSDAAYNHAMMKLGWMTHWQKRPAGEKQTIVDEKVLFPLQSPPNNAPRDFPSLSDYQVALTDLTMAAGKGHLQARLRLGMLFARGVQIPGGTAGGVQQAVSPDCSKALRQFKWIAENACPFRARRLRRAHKQYMAGNTAASLLNYLAAAETGSTNALLNAAFLLEQGECLSSNTKTTTTTNALNNNNNATAQSSSLLNSADCAKASARLWKAAAAKGHGEASLRVGDFYYYRRFREPTAGHLVLVGPYDWIRYFLYPEESIPLLLGYLANQFLVHVGNVWNAATTTTITTTPANQQQQQVDNSNDSVCGVMDDKGLSSSSHQQCANGGLAQTENSEKMDDRQQEAAATLADLEMAAHYYRLATETTDNARAHFNLGFLYEWGLGLKQDFPLAKRHYDLAVSSATVKEADLPVAIALLAMNVHEKCLKWYVAWQAWWEQKSPMLQPWRESLGQNFFWFSQLLTWETVVTVMLILPVALLLFRRREIRQPT